MKNTMNYNDKATKKAAVAALKHLLSTSGETKTMEEVYEAVNSQVKMSKKEFEVLFKEAENEMSSWEKETSSELNEEDLDMVVGGGVLSWIKDHAAEIAIVAGAVLICTGVFAATGAAIAATVAGVSATSSTLTSAVCGAAVGAVLGYELATNGFPSPSEIVRNMAR